LFALVIRLWYNFAMQHVDATFAADAAEYLRDAAGFEEIASLPLNFWPTAARLAFGSLDSTQAAFVHHELNPLKELCQGGPIFPLFILLSFKLCGAQVLSTNTYPPLFMHCLLTSLTCVFIALIGENLWDKKAGILAGLLACVYPGFVVNSGRQYSESLATALACAIILLLSKATIKRNLSCPTSLLLGILAASLHVTRSVMAAMSLALVPITLMIGGEKRNKKLALYLLGFALVFAPWLFLQKCVVGKSSFVVDRLGHYNLFMGNNTDTQGWLVFPYPQYKNVSKESLFHAWQSQFRKSPVRWFKLMLEKPARLLSTPWNDFKVNIGPVDPASQTFFHQFLLLMAALGLVTSLLENIKEPNHRSKLFARLGLLAFFVYHFVYCCFITMSRYALPSIPCVIIFAAAALTEILRHRFTQARLRAYLLSFASTLIFLLIIRADFAIPLTKIIGENWLAFFFVLQALVRLSAYATVLFLCWQFALSLSVPQRAATTLSLLLFVLAALQVGLPLRVYGRWFEWREPFNDKGLIVAQTINLTNERIKKMLMRQSYVIFNIENGAFTANDIQVRINGVPLDSLNIPVMSLAQDWQKNMVLPNGNVCPEIEYIVNDIAYFAGGFPLQLRQWYLSPIGKDELARALAMGESKGFAKNKLVVTLEKLSDRPNAIYGAFRTDNRFLLIPSVTQFSWEKGFFSVENPRGFGDFALDSKITLPIESDQPDGALNGLLKKDFAANLLIRILVSPPVSKGQDGLMRLAVDSKLSQIATSASGIAAGTAAVVDCSSADALKLVRLSADLEAKQGAPDLSVGVIAQFKKPDGPPLLYPSKWLPQVISSRYQKTRMDYSFPIAPACLSAKLTALTATLASLEFFQQPKLSTCKYAPENIAGVESNLRFRIYDLPNNPISPGHEIY